MLHGGSPDLCSRIMREAPASLLRLLLVLPPPLHARAMQARTRLTSDDANVSAVASLCLAEAKDIPSASIPTALNAFALHACQLRGLAALTMICVPGGAASVGVALARVFPLLSALTSLNLAQCALGADNGAAIIRAVPSLHQLAELDLSSNDLSTEIMAAFEHWPARPLGLTALSLAHNAIGVAALSRLRSVLIRTPGLVSLNTTGNVRYEDGENMMYGLLQTLDLQRPLQLRELRVDFMDVMGSATDQTIPSHASSLSRLRVDNRALLAPTPNVAWSVFATDTALLQELHLACGVAFPPGAPIQPLTALTSLALPAPRTPAAVWMEHLSQALASMARLRSFSLMQDERDGFPIRPDRASDDQAVALRGALQPLTGLTRLHIGPYIALQQQQALTLLAGLSAMCKLRAVSIHAIEEVPSMPAELAQPWAAVSQLAFDFSEQISNDRPRVAAATLRSWTAALPQLAQLSVQPELHCHRVLDAPTLSNLTSLRLCACLPREEDEQPLSLTALHAMLAPATALRHLELSQLSVSPAEMGVLLASLAACAQLTRLQLRVSGLLAPWVDCVAQHVPALPRLRHLSLRGGVLHQPSISLTSSRALRNALFGLTELRTLEIAVVAAHLSPFVCALALGAQRLRHLRLWLCDPKGIRRTTDTIFSGEALTELAAEHGSSARAVCSHAGVRLLINDENL